MRIVRSDTWRVALLVLLLGLIVRGLASFVVVPAWETRAGVATFPDRYPALATCLLADGTLAFAPDCDAPTTTRGPGFPLWLALGMILGGGGSGWLGFWSSLPEVITAALLAALAVTRFGRLAALAAGLVRALHPLPVFQGARTFADGWYASSGFLFLLALSAAARCASRTRAAWLLTLATGLASLHLLTRSTGILTLAAVFLASLVSMNRQEGSRNVPRPVPRPRTVALIVALALIPALAWSARTSHLEDRPVFVHSLLHYNYWIGVSHDRDGLGQTSAETWRRERESIRRAAGPELDAISTKLWYDLTPSEVARLESRLAAATRQDILENKTETVLRSLKGTWRFWVLGRTQTRTLQYAFVVVPILLLAMGGCWATLTRWHELDTVSLASAGVIALHLAAYAITAPVAKYSIQVWPEVAWLAGLSLFFTVKRFQAHGSS